jgi:hypothetical protein
MLMAHGNKAKPNKAWKKEGGEGCTSNYLMLLRDKENK